MDVVGVNMNVIDSNQVPRVMNLREVLQSFLDHRHEVLVRRKKFRLNKISHRIEILSGYLITFLNLDKALYFLSPIIGQPRFFETILN